MRPPESTIGDLTGHLDVDRALHEAKAVQVIELGTGPELLAAHRADGDVCVATKATFFQVAVVDTREDEHFPERTEIRCRLFARAQIGLAHDLHERHCRRD